MVCLAAMLVIQAVLFLWVASRSGPTMPGQPPERFAQAAAGDISASPELDPNIDIAQYVREQYGRDAYPLVVLLADGRVIQNRAVPVPEPLLGPARAMLEGRAFNPDRRPAPGLRRGGPGQPFPERGRASGDPSFPPMRPAPIIVHGDLVGVVVAATGAACVCLVARADAGDGRDGRDGGGALLVTVAIFGPARRRLRAVEDAARRLGAGDLSARAPDRGGDEVAAVSAAFNAMADDLARRADALAASDRARRQLLADVSHELTTPVTAVRGYLETLGMPELAKDEATRARYLGVIGDETARLERIIGDLLELARLEGGGGSFAIESAPVDALFARVAARHERACQEAGVTIVTRIDPGAKLSAAIRTVSTGAPEPGRQRHSTPRNSRSSCRAVETG